MPGPGGGSRGGGFGGGSFGGGNRGGGFGGGYHGHGYHHHHYHTPFFFWRRPYYGYGGGCLGGIAGLIMLPVIIVFVIVALAFGMVGDAFTNIKNGGSVEYNEEAFQDYANAQYAREFEGSSSYESNLLLFFLTNEEKDGYYTIAWVGDNVKMQINEMFGNETTEFGITVLSSINEELYKYSLDSNLATVARKMADKIAARGYGSDGLTPFNDKTESVTGVESHLTNNSALPMTEKTVNDALEYFTEQTGIPIVIVVDEQEAAFGVTPPIKDIIILVVFFGLIVLAIVIIIRAIINWKKNGGGKGGDPYDDYNRNYNGKNSGYGGENYGSGGYYR